MAEILVKAIDATHTDSIKDRRGCYKRGMPVVVFSDGHEWGIKETLPMFVVIKIPGISIDKVKKYTKEERIAGPIEPERYRRRLWKIQWNELPQRAKNRLKNDGELIIKAGTYNGTSDYTWIQVKSFFKNHTTGLRETEDL